MPPPLSDCSSVDIRAIEFEIFNWKDRLPKFLKLRKPWPAISKSEPYRP